MEEQIELQAELRTKSGKGEAHRLRCSGKIPAVYYGRGEENILLTLDPHQMDKKLSQKGGMNALIRLKIEGKGDFNVILRDYQADAITRVFTHADFQHVDLTQKISVEVPVHLLGSPQGVKEGGILQQVTRLLTVLCLPTNIPKEITADVSPLKMGQNLHLHELKLPLGVESMGDVDLTIASVLAPREEEVATPSVMTEPEVLTAKKEEGEGTAPPADAKGKAPADKGKPSSGAETKEAKK